MIPWWAILLVIRDLLVVAVLVGAYGLLLRRLATIVEPYRFQLAEAGEKYLPLCKDSKEKRQIQFYLDNAFNPWIAVAATFLILLGLFMALTSYKSNEIAITNEDEHEKICNLFSLSVFAANPLFGTIFVVEMVVIAIVAILVAGNVVLIRRAVAVMLEKQVSRRGGQHLHAH